MDKRKSLIFHAKPENHYLGSMSKRAFKKYLTELPKPALEEQLLDLYDRFPQVKKYYDFVFNPKEDRLISEAQMKISNEYFPLKRKRPRARRSVAQKFIKHFKTLGMDPSKLADLMLYNLEIAQRFEAGRNVPEAFYKSMMNSFTEAIRYISFNGLVYDFKSRIIEIYKVVKDRNWPFMEGFSRALDIID